MTTLEKPNIIDTLLSEGIELKQRGKDFWASCPLHQERTPSFEIDPERQTFHCFGCNEHGDVITFIQKYKGLSFKDSLCYLGIDSSRKIKPDTRVIRKRELIQQYQQWIDDYTNFLCNVLRRLDIAKMKAKTMKQVEAMAFHYHSEHIWEYHLDILLSKDEIAKFEIYKEVMYGKGF